MQTPTFIPTRGPIPTFLVASQPSHQAHATDSIETGGKEGQTTSLHTEKIPLLVIEDHASLVGGMRTELTKEYAAKYVGTKEEVLAALAEKSFALAVVDLTLHQKLEGLELMPVLKKAGIKFLVFSGTAQDWHILAAIRFGALGYVNKRKSLHLLRKALQTIANGEIAFPPEIIEKLRQREASKFPALGPTEIEVLNILMTKVDPETNGIPSNKFICSELYVSLSRVQTIFRILYGKFNIQQSSRVLLYAELQALGYFPGVPLTPFGELGIKL